MIKVYLIILIILLFIYIFTYREGMQTCKYKYLNPPITNNGEVIEWSTNTIKSFVNKWDKINSPNKILEDDITTLFSYIWEEEAKYYIQYGKFPLNQYIKTQFSNEFSTNNELKKYNIKNIDKTFNNRQIYGAFIIASDTNNGTIETLANKIFTGKVLPSECVAKDPSEKNVPKSYTAIPTLVFNKIKKACT